MGLHSMIIAPCGMNCSICMAYLRAKKKCPGCHENGLDKPSHCLKCRIKNCKYLLENKSGFCYECKKFPCTRMKQLDLRYRTNYQMSMIENLEQIQVLGITEFVRKEIMRWTCNNCGGVICVHKGYCTQCKEKK